MQAMQVIFQKYLAVTKIYGKKKACDGRKRFRTVSTASRMTTYLHRVKGVQVLCYPCAFCDGWHIGKYCKEETLDQILARHDRQQKLNLKT